MSAKVNVTRPRSGRDSLIAPDVITSVATVLFSVTADEPLIIHIVLHGYVNGIEHYYVARDLFTEPTDNPTVQNAPAYVLDKDEIILLLFNIDNKETLISLNRGLWKKVIKRLDKKIPQSLVDDALEKFMNDFSTDKTE